MRSLLGAEVFLSSSIRIAEVLPLPEPVTGALILVGAAAGALRRFRARV